MPPLSTRSVETSEPLLARNRLPPQVANLQGGCGPGLYLHRSPTLKAFVANLLPAVPQILLIPPLPFLQNVGVKSNSHSENNFSKNV